MESSVLVALITAVGAIIPALADLFVYFSKRESSPEGHPLQASPQRRALHLALLASLSLILGAGGYTLASYYFGPLDPPVFDGERLTLGGKEFLESSILLELMAITIEHNTGVEVQTRHFLGDSRTCFLGVVAGTIHGYPEYTGTLLSLHLDLDATRIQEERMHQREEVQELLEDKGYDDLVWGERFGFENPYVLVMLRDRARKLGLPEDDATIQDLAEVSSDLVFQGESECHKRNDCLKGLERQYSLSFRAVRDSLHSYKYADLTQGRVDVVTGIKTDPEINLNREKYLTFRDVKDVFPRYYAAPLFHADVLQVRPEVGEALRRLAGLIRHNDIVELVHQSRRNKLHEALPAELRRGASAARVELREICRSFLVQKGVI